MKTQQLEELKKIKGIKILDKKAWGIYNLNSELKNRLELVDETLWDDYSLICACNEGGWDTWEEIPGNVSERAELYIVDEFGEFYNLDHNTLNNLISELEDHISNY